jgi:hypothetical protein
MSLAKIQSLVDRGLLRPKAKVEWKAAVGEDFPTEDVKEQVVFSSYFERGFNLLADDFFRSLLYYYKLELVHLIPNSSLYVDVYPVFVRRIRDIASLSSVEASFLCKEHWQEIRAGGCCDVLLEVRSEVRVDKYRPPRQQRRVEVEVVLYC